MQSLDPIRATHAEVAFASIARRLATATLPQFALAVLLSRLALLILLRLVTAGHELSNDTSMHMGMVREPLTVLLYLVPRFDQNPPLLPFLETVLGYPLQLVFSDFITLRLVMLAYESALGALFYILLGQLTFSPVRRGLCLGAFLVLPMGWMTSIVMAQDEAIAAVAFLLPLVLFLAGKKRTAVLLCGVGVVAGKLFIGLELLTLVALAGPRRWLSWAAIGFSPIIAVYGLMSLYRLQHGLPLPMTGFHPDPSYGTNFWMLLRTHTDIDLRTAGTYSGLLALTLSMIPALILCRRQASRSHPPTAMEVALAVNTSLLLFLSFFYHVNPEYYIMAMPVLLASACNATDAICCVLVSIIPWAGKFFQNAQFMSNAGETTGKQIALKYYTLIFHSAAGSWLAACQILFSLLTVFLCVRYCWRLARPDDAGHARRDAIRPSDVALEPGSHS